MQQAPQKGNKQSSPAKEDGFAKFISMCMYLVLIVNVVTIGLYSYVGTGDEVNCGTGLGASKQVCYLPGWDLTELSIVASILSFLLIFAIGQWQKNNK